MKIRTDLKAGDPGNCHQAFKQTAPPMHENPVQLPALRFPLRQQGSAREPGWLVHILSEEGKDQ